jgi:transcription initiation factor IIF auxiliary subunit
VSPIINRVNSKNKNMRAKTRIVDLLQQLEAHNRAMEAGLNRKYQHDHLLIITQRIQEVIDEVNDLIDVEDDDFESRTGFL